LDQSSKPIFEEEEEKEPTPEDFEIPDLQSIFFFECSF